MAQGGNLKPIWLTWKRSNSFFGQCFSYNYQVSQKSPERISGVPFESDIIQCIGVVLEVGTTRLAWDPTFLPSRKRVASFVNWSQAAATWNHLSTGGELSEKRVWFFIEPRNTLRCSTEYTFVHKSLESVTYSPTTVPLNNITYSLTGCIIEDKHFKHVTLCSLMITWPTCTHLFDKKLSAHRTLTAIG